MATSKPKPKTRSRGFTQTPNDFFDILWPKTTRGVQYAIVAKILRETYGGGKPDNDGRIATRPEYATVTIRGLAKLYDCDAKTVDNALGDAIKRGLIEARRVGRGMEYKCLVDAWESIPNYKFEATAPEATAPEAIAPEAIAPEATAQGDQLVLLPGKRKAVPLQFLIKGYPDPVSMQLDYRSESKGALSFSQSFHGNRLMLVVRDAPAAPVDCSSQLLQSGNLPTDKKELPRDEERATEYRNYIDKVMATRMTTALDWADKRDEAEFQRILRASDGTPLSIFIDIVEARVKYGKGHKPGIFAHLALDAAKRWRLEQRQAAQKQPAPRPAPERTPEPETPNFHRIAMDQLGGSPIAYAKQKKRQVSGSEFMAAVEVLACELKSQAGEE